MFNRSVNSYKESSTYLNEVLNFRFPSEGFSGLDVGTQHQTWGVSSNVIYVSSSNPSSWTHLLRQSHYKVKIQMYTRDMYSLQCIKIFILFFYYGLERSFNMDKVIPSL